MLKTLMMGILAQEVASATTQKHDEERFKEILAGSPLTPIEEVALTGLVSSLTSSETEQNGILSLFNQVL